jgi:CheY-like chemotaxis protein
MEELPVARTYVTTCRVPRASRGDGARCVETLRTWQPQLIWMNLRLPVMGGLEAACRIRQLKGARDGKIVAVSASRFGSRHVEALGSRFRSARTHIVPARSWKAWPGCSMRGNYTLNPRQRRSRNAAC